MKDTFYLVKIYVAQNTKQTSPQLSIFTGLLDIYSISEMLSFYLLASVWGKQLPKPRDNTAFPKIKIDGS